MGKLVRFDRTQTDALDNLLRETGKPRTWLNENLDDELLREMGEHDDTLYKFRPGDVVEYPNGTQVLVGHSNLHGLWGTSRDEFGEEPGKVVGNLIDEARTLLSMVEAS